MSNRTIGYIVGSIASNSINRQLGKALEKLAPEGWELKEIEIKDLPFYNYHLDGNFPEVAVKFKKEITDAAGVIIITPEYSRSIPGVLKNALDWAARPYGEGSFNGKPTAVIGATGGNTGTAVAQQHLRNILSHFNAATLGQPEAFVHYNPELIAADFSVNDPQTDEFLRGYLAAFTQLIERTQR